MPLLSEYPPVPPSHHPRFPISAGETRIRRITSATLMAATGTTRASTSLVVDVIFLNNIPNVLTLTVNDTKISSCSRCFEGSAGRIVTFADFSTSNLTSVLSEPPTRPSGFRDTSYVVDGQLKVCQHFKQSGCFYTQTHDYDLEKQESRYS